MAAMKTKQSSEIGAVWAPGGESLGFGVEGLGSGDLGGILGFRLFRTLGFGGFGFSISGFGSTTNKLPNLRDL